jgi:hypothetical protein
MGLKGYRLWGMGQLDSNVQVPTAADVRARHGEARHGLGRGSAPQTKTPVGPRRDQGRASLADDTGLASGRHGKRHTHATIPALVCAASTNASRPVDVSHTVALQVAFERQTLKPVFSLDSL